MQKVSLVWRKAYVALEVRRRSHRGRRTSEQCLDVRS